MNPDVSLAKKILSLIDLTSLNGNETAAHITKLCQSAFGSHGTVAAICVYPAYIKLAKTTLKRIAADHPVRIATVVNFPHGNNQIDLVLEKTSTAINQGAQEIDLVLPYQRFLAGDIKFCTQMLMRCRQVCGEKINLKVIIESGVLNTPEAITHAALLAIDCNADFIKTSTGKVPVNATIPAAEAILQAIKASGQHHVGFKASGGIRTIREAAEYIQLCERIMGPEWITPAHFRFGASGLLADINVFLDHAQSTTS